jgi:predicted nucleic acid-binding protein
MRNRLRPLGRGLELSNLIEAYLLACRAEGKSTNTIRWYEQKLRTFLEYLRSQRLDETLLPNLPVLPFDASAARRYGEVRAELERRGTPIGDADLRIASIALARNLTVVTGNVRHFRKVPGLAVENWLE